MGKVGMRTEVGQLEQLWEGDCKDEENNLTQLTPILQQERLPQSRKDSFDSVSGDESPQTFSQVSVSGLKPGREGFQTNPVYQWGGKESFAQIVEKGFPEAPWNVNRGEKRLASPRFERREC